ncbi:MAG: hypothetical protein IJX53_00775 [Clostridia bacterium]|nr:hypothetical protein [Clostridia bacterium]
MAVNRVQRADGTIELDVTGVTAAAADVAAGKKFVTAAGELADGAMPSVTQATPSISVSSGGLITASATQAAGKVAAGTKSATKQLTVQAAKTVTPTTTEQVAVAAGVYTTGAVKVAAVGADKVVQGSFATTSYQTFTISGLTFSKVKCVFIGTTVTNAGSNMKYAYFFHNGEGKAYVYFYNGGVTTINGSDASTFTYSNGTLTINTGGYMDLRVTAKYTIIGE